MCMYVYVCILYPNISTKKQVFCSIIFLTKRASPFLICEPPIPTTICQEGWSSLHTKAAKTSCVADLSMMYADTKPWLRDKAL